jgi:hypothetical protein
MNHMLDAAFVFVVCGSKEHIETLNFSYNELKKRTRFPIYIITDSIRNEVPIELENCIDVEVNKELTNHQASIFLKTSLHRYLPSHECYCYLDTDVLACGNHTDAIFDQYATPITFGSDHCTMPQFSPTAVKCNCEKNQEKEQALWHREIGTLKQHVENQKLLNKVLDTKKKTLIGRIILLFRYYTSYPLFKLNDTFYFNKRNRVWHHVDFGSITWEFDKVCDEDGLCIFHDKSDFKWKNSVGRDIWDNACNCLSIAIYRDLGISVAEENWQHWNGGVFLFSKESSAFLDEWHRFTIQIFNNPFWKTRDQGTLIATVWKMHLEAQPILANQWNFLVDANNEAVVFNEDGIGSIDGGRNTFKTEFAHIYHRFGDATWSVWQNVVKLLNNG